MVQNTKDDGCDKERFYVNVDGNPDPSYADYYCGYQRVTRASTGNNMMIGKIHSYFMYLLKFDFEFAQPLSVCSTAVHGTAQRLQFVIVVSAQM